MDNIINFLTSELNSKISENVRFQDITEIRLRVNCPLIVKLYDEEILMQDVILKNNDIDNVFDKLTKYSAYAYENPIREGYLTIEGGHRVGFGGEGVIENDKIKAFKNIRFMNIRICHEIKGCGQEVAKQIVKDGQVENALIISPPGLGKTTLLRDLIKNFSINLVGTSISVIDERNEISGSYMGVPSIDLGWRTDVISNCSKEYGIKTAVRAMSPEIIVVDEIGGTEDIKALEFASKCGVKIIATIHGGTVEDARVKLGEAADKIFKKKILIKEKGEYLCY